MCSLGLAPAHHGLQSLVSPVKLENVLSNHCVQGRRPLPGADLIHEALGRLLARVAAQAQVRAVHQALADRQLRRVDVVLLHVATDAREALLLLGKTLRVSTYFDVGLFGIMTSPPTYASRIQHAQQPFIWRGGRRRTLTRMSPSILPVVLRPAAEQQTNLRCACAQHDDCSSQPGTFFGLFDATSGLAPARQSMRVVLPAPDTPTNAVSTPGWNAPFTSCSAVRLTQHQIPWWSAQSTQSAWGRARGAAHLQQVQARCPAILPGVRWDVSSLPGTHEGWFRSNIGSQGHISSMPTCLPRAHTAQHGRTRRSQNELLLLTLGKSTLYHRCVKVRFRGLNGSTMPFASSPMPSTLDVSPLLALSPSSLMRSWLGSTKSARNQPGRLLDISILPRSAAGYVTRCLGNVHVLPEAAGCSGAGSTCGLLLLSRAVTRLLRRALAHVTMPAAGGTVADCAILLDATPAIGPHAVLHRPLRRPHSHLDVAAGCKPIARYTVVLHRVPLGGQHNDAVGPRYVGHRAVQLHRYLSFSMRRSRMLDDHTTAMPLEQW